MYQIKEYEKKYSKQINEFVIGIYIDEYGFEEHRKNLEKHDNDYYHKSGGKLLVALDENENIIGTIAICKINNEEVELKRFYVRKDYRGTGLSDKLYEKVINICKENKIRRIFLGTFEKFEKEIKFYIKKGFNEVENGIPGAKYFELNLM